MKNSYFFLLFISRDCDIKHESNRHCFSSSLWKDKEISLLLLVEKEFFTDSLFAVSPLQNQKRILDGQKVTTIIWSVSLIDSRGI